MKEVLSRRFARMDASNRPDVILLDGGRGQLNAVHESLKDFDLDGIAIIAISKGPERNAGKEFYHMKDKESFALPFQSPIAFYLQICVTKLTGLPSVPIGRRGQNPSLNRALTKWRESAAAASMTCLIILGR